MQSQFQSGQVQEAIAHYRDALALLPPGHPNRFLSRNNLANSMQMQSPATTTSSFCFLLGIHTAPRPSSISLMHYELVFSRPVNCRILRKGLPSIVTPSPCVLQGIHIVSRLSAVGFSRLANSRILRKRSPTISAPSPCILLDIPVAPCASNTLPLPCRLVSADWPEGGSPGVILFT
jgi:hypothetical protein